MPEFFDIHSHINFKDYNDDREEIIARMAERGVWTTTIGTDIKTSREAVELAQKHFNLFATVGVHPGDSHDPFIQSEYEELVKDPKVVAVGECGLDYGKEGNATDEEKARQRKDFVAQINFAVAHDKPLMIHCRSAYEDVLDILESEKKNHGDKLRAHMHFFAGSLDVLRRTLQNDFTVSFTGVITFAKQYEELVKFAPLSSIMAETDAPFVTPVPHRGQRNLPEYVKHVVKAISDIRDNDFETVKKAMVGNAFRVFRIPRV